LFFVIKDNKNIYCRPLPFVFKGLPIDVREQRLHDIEIFASTQQFDIFCGMHYFLSEEETEMVECVSKDRAKLKEYEHRKGDNADNMHRIKTGNKGELAFEKLTGIKSTDFDNATECSSQFLVADNKILNIGIKSAESYNASYIIEQNNNINQVLFSNIKRRKRKGSHMVLRGIASTHTLSDKTKWSYNTAKMDSLLAKFLLYDTKVGIRLLQGDIEPIYDLNEVNMNPQNLNLYKTKSIIINREVTFDDLSDDFIASFEKEMLDCDMKFAYIDVRALGFETLKSMQKQYENTDSDIITAFENFAMKYRLGIVFYDNTEMRKRANTDRQNIYYNYSVDNNLIGMIYPDGSVKRKERKC
jgi:hypothetical protein